MLKLYHFACAIGLMSSLANQAVAKPDFYELESDANQDSISLRHPTEVDATSTLAVREMTSQPGALDNRSTYLPTIVREAEPLRHVAPVRPRECRLAAAVGTEASIASVGV